MLIDKHLNIVKMTNFLKLGIIIVETLMRFFLKS